MADDTVKVSFVGDSSSLRRAVDESDGHLAKLSSSIAGFAKAAAVGFAAGGVAVGAFAKSAVSAASDLAESQGKVGVVFGEQAKDIEAWASTSAKAFGQSKQSALEAVGTYGNLFQAFGVGRGESAKMSKSLVELAADMASFNNTSVDDALQALQSGLSGETEPLKRFGVAINDARLKEEALRLGLIKTTKEALSPAAKAQAAYALVMKDTALAQGDFARTSDGLANKTRILKARFADIQAEIGTRLIPIVSSLAGFILDKLIPAFQFIGTEAAGAIAAFINAFRAGGKDVTSSGFAGAIERIGLAAREVFDWLRANVPRVVDALVKGFQDYVVPAFQAVADVIMNDLWPALRTVFEFVNEHREILVGVAVAVGVGLVAAFLSWAAAAAAAAAATIAATAPIIAIGIAIAALVAGVIYAYQHFETFREVVDAVGRFIAGVLNDIADNWRDWGAVVVEVVETAIGVVRTVIETVLGAIQAFWRTWGDEVMLVVRTVFDFIRTFIESTLKIVHGIVNTIMGLIHGDFSQVWDGIKEIFAGALGYIEGLVRAALGLLEATVSAGMTAVAGVFDAAWDGLKRTVGLAWDAIRGVVSGGVAEIKAFFDDLGGAIVGFGQAFWRFVDGMRQQLAEWVLSVWRNGGLIIDFFRNLPGNIAEFFGGLAETIASPFRTAFNAIASMWNRTVGSLSFSVPSWIPGIGGNGWDVPNIPEWAKGGVAPRGWNIVGEDGPELVNFGSPSRVLNNADTMRALGGSSGAVVNLTVNVGNVDSPARVDSLAFVIQRQLAVALRGAVG